MSTSLLAKRAALLSIPEGVDPTEVSAPITALYHSPTSFVPTYIRMADGSVVYYIACQVGKDGVMTRAMSVRRFVTETGEVRVAIQRNIDIPQAVQAAEQGMMVDALTLPVAVVLASALAACADGDEAANASEALDDEAVVHTEACWPDAQIEFVTVADLNAALADAAGEADQALVAEAIATAESATA